MQSRQPDHRQRVRSESAPEGAAAAAARAVAKANARAARQAEMEALRATIIATLNQEQPELSGMALAVVVAKLLKEHDQEIARQERTAEEDRRAAKFKKIKT